MKRIMGSYETRGHIYALNRGRTQTPCAYLQPLTYRILPTPDPWTNVLQMGFMQPV